MLGPELGRHENPHSRGQGLVDHSRIDAFGVEVDLERTAGSLGVPVAATLDPGEILRWLDHPDTLSSR